MSIYLGDLMPEQIERRLGIELSTEDKKILLESHQGTVNNIPIDHGKWHCFDIPFMMMTGSMETAVYFRDLFMKYHASTFKECFQIAWDRKGEEE